eukprot:1156636-Pelagomonas_calceolata.AAC.21
MPYHVQDAETALCADAMRWATRAHTAATTGAVTAALPEQQAHQGMRTTGQRHECRHLNAC